MVQNGHLDRDESPFRLQGFCDRGRRPLAPGEGLLERLSQQLDHDRQSVLRRQLSRRSLVCRSTHAGRALGKRRESRHAPQRQRELHASTIRSSIRSSTRRTGGSSTSKARTPRPSPAIRLPTPLYDYNQMMYPPRSGDDSAALHAAGGRLQPRRHGRCGGLHRLAQYAGLARPTCGRTATTPAPASPSSTRPTTWLGRTISARWRVRVLGSTATSAVPEPAALCADWDVIAVGCVTGQASTDTDGCSSQRLFNSTRKSGLPRCVS